MKTKIRIVCELILLATLAYGAEKVLTWDDTEPFPFGGDFLRSGILPMTGNLNVGGQAVTNASLVQATALTVTGGSPTATNNNVFVATNAAGQGAWGNLTCPIKFSATQGTGQKLNSGITKIVYDSIITNVGNCYNANGNFTPALVGRYLINAGANAYLITNQTTSIGLWVYRNAVAYRHIETSPLLAQNEFSIAGCCEIDNDNPTNVFDLRLNLYLNNQLTNRASAGSSVNFFSGTFLGQ